MAEKNAQEVNKDSGGSVAYKWNTLASGDNCDWIDLSNYPDKTVQVYGDAVGSVSIQGSNDKSNPVILTDLAGDPLTFTAAGMKNIRENPRFIRPLPTTATNVTVIINAAK